MLPLRKAKRIQVLELRQVVFYPKKRFREIGAGTSGSSTLTAPWRWRFSE
jgi:hypothetical protein